MGGGHPGDVAGTSGAWTWEKTDQQKSAAGSPAGALGESDDHRHDYALLPPERRKHSDNVVYHTTY